MKHWTSFSAPPSCLSRSPVIPFLVEFNLKRCGFTVTELFIFNLWELDNFNQLINKLFNFWLSTNNCMKKLFRDYCCFKFTFGHSSNVTHSNGLTKKSEELCFPSDSACMTYLRALSPEASVLLKSLEYIIVSKHATICHRLQYSTSWQCKYGWIRSSRRSGLSQTFFQKVLPLDKAVVVLYCHYHKNVI